MLDRRWLANDGPYVQELEKKLAAFLNVKQCIARCNVTIALEIAARAWPAWRSDSSLQFQPVRTLYSGRLPRFFVMWILFVRA